MKQQGVTPIVIIILVSAILSIGGYLAYKWFYSPATQNSSWRVYADSEFNYSLKYPPDFQIGEWRDRSDISLSNKTFNISILVRSSSDQNKNYGSYLWAKSVTDSLSQIPDNTDTSIGVKVRKTLVSGIPAIEYKITKNHTNEEISIPTLNMVFIKDGKSYLISAIANDYTEKIFDTQFMNIFDQIFSTFKVEGSSAEPVTFLKRYYKTTDKIFDTKEYPDEMKNLTDRQLVGLRCSEEYGDIFNKISETDIKPDSVLQKIMNAAKSLDYYHTIQAVKYCQLEDTRVLVAIYNFPDGWRYTSANFGLLENGKLNFKISFQPPGEAGAPMIGFAPLQYTLDDKFYYSQGGGDNISEISILRMDLRLNTNESILNCIDSYTTSDGRVTEPTCR